MGRWGIRGLKAEVDQECSISRGGPDCTVEVYMSEEVSVTSRDAVEGWGGGSSKSESCQEF